MIGWKAQNPPGGPHRFRGCRGGRSGSGDSVPRADLREAGGAATCAPPSRPRGGAGPEGRRPKGPAPWLRVVQPGGKPPGCACCRV